MDAIQVLILVGGISSTSLNQKFYQSILNQGFDSFHFSDFDISKLPYFSQDIENDPPDVVTEFKEKIREADAILFITPEYNRSYPGVLKNAIDWGSRPYGTNLWNNKLAGLMGASAGNIGTFGAQNHLRQVFVYLNMRVMAQPEFYFNGSKAFDEKGQLINEKTKELLHAYFETFKIFIESETHSAHSSYKSKGLEDSPSLQ